jgi:hypothetical protein
MSRRIVTKQLDSAGAKVEVDTYFDKLFKYIPADIVGAWIAVKGLIIGASDVPKKTIFWIAFGIGVIVTFLWTLLRTKDPDHKPAITQTIISTIAFVIWVIALGGFPFNMNPLYGSLLLILFTLVMAMINPPES